ncbi:MAG: glycosyltransferase family 9 protein [Geobacteraceae bacterium]|nr:glycosyltransferase family 9 protein [Geobacteraceae bacterium]
MEIDKAKKRILVLRYRFIGDTILTVPFLRNLRHAEPDSYIAWVVAPGSTEVINGIPYVDELIFWDPVTIHAGCRGTHRTLRAKLAFIRDLRARRFDKAYVLKRSLSSALMAFLASARERIGFDTEGRGFLLTRRLPYRHDRHEVENFLEVLKVDGIPVVDDHLESWLTADEMLEAEQLIAPAAGARLLAIHPFSSTGGRSWPLEDFARVATALHASYGFCPVVLGGGGDREAFQACRDLFPADTIDLVGRSSIKVHMAVLRKCALFVGNDSSNMHMAAASGTPTIALFGPSSPTRFGPWGKNARVIYRAFSCSPCRQKFFTECDPSPRMKPACIEAISVDDVLRECQTLLGEVARR